MARKQPPMRTLSHASSIKIGDNIRISGSIEDMQISRVGVVAKRDISNMGTDYLTKNGMSLLTVFRDGTCGIQNVKIQLLNTTPEPTLFEYSESDSLTTTKDLLNSKYGKQARRA